MPTTEHTDGPDESAIAAMKERERARLADVDRLNESAVNKARGDRPNIRVDLSKQTESVSARPLPLETAAPDPLLQFFAYDHLPPRLREISSDFSFLASHIVATLPRNPERTVALRKLLEAKDCAVRAVLYK